MVIEGMEGLGRLHSVARSRHGIVQVMRRSQQKGCSWITKYQPFSRRMKLEVALLLFACFKPYYAVWRPCYRQVGLGRIFPMEQEFLRRWAIVRPLFSGFSCIFPCYSKEAGFRLTVNANERDAYGQRLDGCLRLKRAGDFAACSRRNWPQKIAPSSAMGPKLRR